MSSTDRLIRTERSVTREAEIKCSAPTQEKKCHSLTGDIETKLPTYLSTYLSMYLVTYLLTRIEKDETKARAI